MVLDLEKVKKDGIKSVGVEDKQYIYRDLHFENVLVRGIPTIENTHDKYGEPLLSGNVLERIYFLLDSNTDGKKEINFTWGN